MLKRVAAVAAIFLLAACAAPTDAPPVAQLSDARSGPVVSVAPTGWHALLVAGDNSSPAFDNGVETLRERLAGLGVHTVRTFTASRGPDNELASSANVRAGLRTVGGDACFVYMTSHGDQRGFFLRADQRLFTPATFDLAVEQGCGAAPTVLVVSACHSGAFITPQTSRPNRIILTAAAIDRTSFGCGADDDYTYYDQCFLQQLDMAQTWRDVALGTRSCVEMLERRLGVRQESRPQMFFGAEVANLRLPGR
jgi:hypothetical protein